MALGNVTAVQLDYPQPVDRRDQLWIGLEGPGEEIGGQAEALAVLLLAELRQVQGAEAAQGQGLPGVETQSLLKRLRRLRRPGRVRAAPGRAGSSGQDCRPAHGPVPEQTLRQLRLAQFDQQLGRLPADFA